MIKLLQKISSPTFCKLNNVFNTCKSFFIPTKPDCFVKSCEEEAVKLFDSFSIKLPNNNEKVIVGMKKGLREQQYSIFVENQYNYLLAYNDILFKFNKTLRGINMRVFDKNDRNKGIGRLMRLMSIAEMFNNNMNRIMIDAADTAVMFHFRHKFVPHIRENLEAHDILGVISEPFSAGFDDLAQRAKEIKPLLKKMNRIKNPQEQVFIPISQLTLEFLNRIEQKGLKPERLGSNGMVMVLTKERVLQNKDFFNPLFEQYGINFRL